MPVGDINPVDFPPSLSLSFFSFFPHNPRKSGSFRDAEYILFLNLTRLSDIDAFVSVVWMFQMTIQRENMLSRRNITRETFRDTFL